MKFSPKTKLSKRFIGHRSRATTIGTLLLVLCLTHSGCFTTVDPATYYGEIVVPKTQLFRWSDGGLPQTFDPAFAAAAPDTDVVRALFEGLTDYDPRTLQAVPAVATRWESSTDHRSWTFYLREDARWSNGERVTASDFVKSWERTLRIGALAPHTELLSNIEGASFASGRSATLQAPIQEFGAEAVNDHLLRVRLAAPDVNFPALVAHPVFRPVKVTESNQTKRLEPGGLVSNGAFSLVGTEAGRVLLERAKNYWDGGSVALDQVEFVAAANSEAALAAYRAGRVDAVTSAAFEPLALKLLAPFKDFRRSTFGALTFYSFNITRAPFDDVRIREALAISIDRERVSRHDLGGATEAAGKFLPEAMTGDKPVVSKTDLLEPNIAKARELFAAAGYADGEGFPVIKLLINRNEQQRIVAQSIAEMWRSALNIQTEIVMKSWDEYEAAMRTGDFDVVRRGIVMQTTDELTNLRLLFHAEIQPSPTPSPSPEGPKGRGEKTAGPNESPKLPPQIESEVQALKELKAMPIYFASSYALVKPYVSGFDANVLDAPSLKRTRIDTGWVERKP